MSEQLILELRYIHGDVERVLPAVHPDLPLEHQAELLRKYIIRQFAAGRPLALEVEGGGKRDARLIVPVSVLRGAEVSIVGAPVPSADEYQRPIPEHLRRQ